MSRIAPLQLENTSGHTKVLLEGVQKTLGMVPNMMRTMAVAPKMLEGYLQLSGTLGAGKLSAKSRELISLAVAQANDCDYCLAAHTAIGGMVGLTKEEIQDGRRGTATDTRANAVLNLAGSILNGRGRIDDAEYAAARNAGLDDAEIAETVANVALNILTNYFNNLVQTAVDFPAAPPLEGFETASCSVVGACAH